MADVACIFHWSLADMDKMEIEDLVEWADRAAERGKLLIR